MSNNKKKPASTPANCLPQEVFSVAPQSGQKKINKPKRIPRNKYDKESAAILAKILSGEEDVKRPSIRIPEYLYPYFKYLISLKGQSFQEYALALLLQDWDQHEKQGVFDHLPNRYTH